MLSRHMIASILAVAMLPCLAINTGLAAQRVVLLEEATSTT